MRILALALLLFVVIAQTLVIAWMWERYGWRSNLWLNVGGIAFSIAVLGPIVVSS